MWNKWMVTPWSELGFIFLTFVFTYIAIIAYTRIAGLRSFSKMSASDFSMTVAVGSLFGSTISSPQPTMMAGLFSLALLFAGQWLVSVLRQRYRGLNHLIDNRPLLLMAHGQMIEEHLHLANITREDVLGKLREANVQHPSQVTAVVFETTGDVSVLHSSDSSTPISPVLFDDVIGAEQLFQSKKEPQPL